MTNPAWFAWGFPAATIENPTSQETLSLYMPSRISIYLYTDYKDINRELDRKQSSQDWNRSPYGNDSWGAGFTHDAIAQAP